MTRGGARPTCNHSHGATGMAGQLWTHKRRFRREALAALLFLSALSVGLVICFKQPAQFRSPLSITGGSASGMRSQIARRLVAEAGKQGLSLRLRETGGSKEALERVEQRSIDMAFVQGGIESSAYPHVRQVAALHVEPLHLVVKPDLYRAIAENLANLRGKTVNVSSPASGTHDLAIDVLKFAGLRPRRRDRPGAAEDAGHGEGDYVLSTVPYSELEALIDHNDLPDAVFTVSDLPSPIVRHLVLKRGYQLVSLPFGEAFFLDAFENRSGDRSQSSRGKTDEVDRFRIYPAEIPAFTYGIEPPSPPAALATFGPRLLLVAHESTPNRAVRAILEAVFSTNFAQDFRPLLDPSLLDLAPEYPWHAGTDEYREFHKPILAGEVIDLMEKTTSMAGVIAGALFFLWQWFRQYNRRKRELSFESYMIKVANVEQRALDLELSPTLDLKELLALQIELNRLKNDALLRFAEGKLEGEALISGFIAHVNDARNHLTRLILHERDNLENRAESEARSAEALWAEAVGKRPPETHDMEMEAG
jgi:TRAP-type uncharacterized transport system substrate-binding protein